MTIKNLLSIFMIMTVTVFFMQCGADKETNADLATGLPTTFSVDIPSSISRTLTTKSASSDEFSGREIYEHLSNFIHVGEAAAEFVEEIMKGISKYELNEPTNFNFISNDDGRSKNMVVVDNADYEGVGWQHGLTLADTEYVTNNDGGIALQVFWNTNPISGIAIFKPGNWEVDADNLLEETIFKIEYSEVGAYGYDAHMIVSIANWQDAISDRFHMDELKMFVGKSGNIIDVYGNSIHPDAYLFVEEPKGFCWAFVASCNGNSNIAVAEVGLPPHTLDENSRSILLEDYSIENVFTDQFVEWVYQNHGFYPNDDQIADILVNTDAPAFFDANGFVQGGEAPSLDYEELVNNIQLLTPFNPKSIDEMVISLKSK